MKKVNAMKLNEILNELKNKKLTDKLIDEIMQKLSQPSHQKIIEKDGKQYAWCNFHKTYEPIENFATKSNGKLKSNCREGDKLLRKYRALKRKINDINLQLYRVGMMNPDLENELNEKLTFDLVNEYDFDIVPIIDAIYPDDIKQKAISLIKIK